MKQGRADKSFCGPICVAAWYRLRDNPPPIHEEKFRVHWFTCEQCFEDFQVNDYANRGGQRTPKYCSNACKQKAYRKRNKGHQEQAKRRGNSKANNKSGGSTGAGDDRYKYNPNAGTRYQQALLLFGLREPFTQKDLKRAYFAEVKKWHPDRNKSPEATEKTQYINSMYDTVNARHGW